MSRNIEHGKREPTHAVQLLDVCRQNPDTFIPIMSLKEGFGWSFPSVKTAVVEARRRLINDVLYTVSLEGGIVYEPTRVAVGERIEPKSFRPDPRWLSEFPERPDIRDLFKQLRFATVASDVEAKPLLSPNEHILLTRLAADMVGNKVSSMDRLSFFIPKLAKKLMEETKGEWVVTSERRSGLFYVLKHNGV